MSEMINNREYRQKALKEMITQLHHGKASTRSSSSLKSCFRGFRQMKSPRWSRHLSWRECP